MRGAVSGFAEGAIRSCYATPDHFAVLLVSSSAAVAQAQEKKGPDPEALIQYNAIFNPIRKSQDYKVERKLPRNTARCRDLDLTADYSVLQGCIDERGLPTRR
jgi:hypothetical protein